jgi:hypothetical protein
MKDQLKTDPDFLSKIITGDESWCYDFFLFPRLKRDLKGKRFQNVEEVREKRQRH